MIIKATYDPPSIHTRCLASLLMDACAGKTTGGYRDRAGSTSKQSSLPCSTSYTLLESPDCQTPLLLLFVSVCFLGRQRAEAFQMQGVIFSTAATNNAKHKEKLNGGNGTHLHCRLGLLICN